MSTWKLWNYLLHDASHWIQMIIIMHYNYNTYIQWRVGFKGHVPNASGWPPINMPYKNKVLHHLSSLMHVHPPYLIVECPPTPPPLIITTAIVMHDYSRAGHCTTKGSTIHSRTTQPTYYNIIIMVAKMHVALALYCVYQLCYPMFSQQNWHPVITAL